MDVVANAGEREGIEAWRMLVRKYDPRIRSRWAGQLLEIMAWNFDGDVVGRIEAFEREITQYEFTSKETITGHIKCGIVLRQMEDGPLT